MEWIDANDKKPEKNCFVIIRQREKGQKRWEISPGYFSVTGGWSEFFPYNECCNSAGEVSHWMPLPEPPEEK